MPIDLQKIDRGARVDLTKGNPGLDKITIGLKWNSGVVKQDVSAQNSDQKRRGGFLGALGSLVSQGVNEVERAVEGAVKIDLDTSVFEMDESGKIISRIYFGEQSNRNGSIQLSGDDRTGKNKTTTEDNEQMWLSLSNINPAASKIHIWSNVYDCVRTGQHFGMVPNGRMRIMKGGKNDQKEEMYIYNLNGAEYNKMTAMHFGVLYRHGDEWKFRAIGNGYNYKSISEILENKREWIDD